MADVSRDEFSALTTRVAALEGRLGTTPSTPATPAIPATGASGSSGPSVTGPTGASAPASTVPLVEKPVVSVNGASYTVTGSVTALEAAASFTYLQIAVRGAGATDLALSPDTKLARGGSKKLSGTGQGTGGEYTTWIAYSLDGATWVDGPKTPFTLTAAPAASAPAKADPTAQSSVPLAGKSHLSFNSIVFRTSVKAAEEFGTRRGNPMDGLLYFTGRSNWNDFRWLAEGMRDYLASGHIVVMTMPHAPESEGSSMNVKGANDAYKSQQRDLGKYLADAGVNSPNLYIRTAWECNGNWYAWSIKNGGAEALKASVRNQVINLRAGGLTKNRWGMCNNKGPSQSGASAFDAFPGAEYIDNMGIDCYDMWGPSYTESDWEREMAKNPSPRSTAAFAKQHGITWSWDEGGPTHGDKNQGGDNPFYFEMRRKEIQRSIDNFAYDCTYDDPGAPASLMHDFARNPKCWAKYTSVGMWKPA